MRVGTSGVAALAMLLILSWPAEAGEERVRPAGGSFNRAHLPPQLTGRLESVPALQKIPRGGGNFYSAHLLPQITRHLESVPAIQEIPRDGCESADLSMFEHVTEAARHEAERGAKKALKSYLLHVTSLDGVYRSLKGGRRSRDLKEGKELSVVDYGVRISHGAAKLEVRRKLQSGEFTAGVDTHGGFGLEYEASERTGMRLFAHYDARNRSYAFACRFDFSRGGRRLLE
jgi:hypothetical protein